MFFAVLCVSLHSAFCVDGRNCDLESTENLDAHTVVVQFFACTGLFYKMSWDTFGLMYNGCSSVEAVLARGLHACGCEEAFTPPELEISQLFKNVLQYCFEKNTHITYPCSVRHKLLEEHLAQMFPDQERKRWTVLDSRTEADKQWVRGEFRVLFSGGGYSCQPISFQQKVPLEQKSFLRKSPVRAEPQESFVHKVCLCAQRRWKDLEHFNALKGGQVSVRCVDAQGTVRGAVWDIRYILDENHCSVGEFLRNCVMQGSCLNEQDQVSFAHYAFINEDICFMLRKRLIPDLKDGRRLLRLRGAKRLKSDDVLALPHLSWTVVPEGFLQRPQFLHTCSLTFPGVTLEGVPLVEDFTRPQGSLLPGSFLWALAYEELLKKKPENASWYAMGPHRFSAKMRWVEPDTGAQNV